MSEAYITFIVTQDCQLRCKYCYLTGKNSFGRMDIQTAQKAFDVLFSNKLVSNNNSVTFDFIGGEPLLEIDLIDEILCYVINKLDYAQHHWKSNFHINITTNGLLYSSAKVQKFIKKYKDRLTLSISIDGTKEKNDKNRVFKDGKGSFEKLFPNVKLWIKQFKSVNTRMTISREDLPYIYESLKFFVKIGIRNIDVNPVLEAVWHPGDELIFEQQLKQFADYIIDNNLFNKVIVTCFDGSIGHPINITKICNPCGASMFTIDNLGNFYTCLRFASFSLNKVLPRKIGDIKKGINWNILRPFESMTYDSLLSDKCLSCAVASGCKFCPALNYDNSCDGSIFNRITAICEMHKAKVRARNYLFDKIKWNNNGRD